MNVILILMHDIVIGLFINRSEACCLVFLKLRLRNSEEFSTHKPRTIDE